MSYVVIITVVVLLAVVAVIVYMYVKKDKYTVTRNFDYSGNDITSLDNSTLEQCTEKCNTTTGCVGFNYSTLPGKVRCWIKNKLGNEEITDKWDFYKKN